MTDRRDGSRGTRRTRRTHRTRRTGPRLAVDMDRVVVIRRRGDVTSLEHTPRLIDWEAAKAVEVFCTGYDGDDLLHDIELAFPTLSYRDFFVGFGRWQEAEAMMRGRRSRGPRR